MFLDYIKSFVLKKTLKKNLCNVKEESLHSSVIKIGLIVDESNFLETAALKQEIISKGILENNLKIIAFRKSLSDKEQFLNPTFGYKDLNFKSDFIKQSVNEFLQDEFDLLINYYSEEEPILLFLTHKTKAKFKAGFSSVDKRLNHFLINIQFTDYKEFVSELFRYLKILNKI
ncbi:DUF6913 domain-containing protein [Flavobacterium gilvum]|uniref:Uncharacterized protein n=1 Tax=Flavobacterium gilvum TaxID=1492737 RepID=A0AAC9N635_9FLAO|nr:hypothetical protein [Flavobacterium gilvum]AOW10691.1 hypothetical protein EM308_14975 [Flavobacterium gilvum]KFC60319.1 hypothetical protein FEM08_09260 [Flavobacterium gilvum]